MGRPRTEAGPALPALHAHRTGVGARRSACRAYARERLSRARVNPVRSGYTRGGVVRTQEMRGAPRTGAERRPRQEDGRAGPRARLREMPAINERSASAPKAPHQAVDVGKRIAATASSARGSPIASGFASEAGRPKSIIVCREPELSTSLATPATANTNVSSNFITRRAASNSMSPSVRSRGGAL